MSVELIEEKEEQVLELRHFNVLTDNADESLGDYKFRLVDCHCNIGCQIFCEV